MKKLFLAIIMIASFLSSYGAGPGICRIRHNGTLGIWFRYVSWDPGSILVAGEQCLNCHSPGNQRCIPQNAAGGFPANFDQIDKDNCRLALEHIDSQVENKIYEGSYQLIVQVAGEPFKRVYNASWALGPKGEGNDRFWRTDVNL